MEVVLYYMHTLWYIVYKYHICVQYTCTHMYSIHMSALSACMYSFFAVRKSHEKHGRLKGNKERGEKADEESRDKFSEQKAAASPDNLALSEVVCVAAAGEYSDAQRRSCLPGKRRDQQARYWSYLFDNLHRVVDEIYCTCEADESIIECQVLGVNELLCAYLYVYKLS